MNIGWLNRFTEFNQSPNTFVFMAVKPCCSQTLGDKVQCRKGKSPNCVLRSLKNSLVVKVVFQSRQRSGRLRISNSVKESVKAHTSKY